MELWKFKSIFTKIFFQTGTVLSFSV